MSSVVQTAKEVILGIDSVIEKLNDKRRKNPFIDSTGSIIKPFPCASCDIELICDDFQVAQDNGASIVFDFDKADLQADRIHFVSVVYSFPKPISIKRFNVFKFTLSFDAGNFDQVDVEMKSSQDSRKYDPVTVCKRDDNTTHEVSLHFLRKDVLEALNQICFVVKVQAAEGKSKSKGRFTVKSVSFQ